MKRSYHPVVQRDRLRRGASARGVMLEGTGQLALVKCSAVQV
jgi:hypothetical protein